MRRLTKNSLAIVVLVSSLACTFFVSQQNPEKAAASATEFAEVAFVERNIDKAYDLLDPEFQTYATKKKFAEVLAAINSPTSPTTVTATEFESIPNQEGVNIFLIGENKDEKFYYRLPMKGTEEKGYKVAGIFRGKDQYEPSALRRPLQIKRSTGN
jgi:hypothetical protein